MEAASGSRSPSPGGRPHTASRRTISAAMFEVVITPWGPPIPRRMGRSASSMWWPSSSHSATAASMAPRATSSISIPSAEPSHTAIRSGGGGTAMAASKVVSGVGAT